MKRDKDTQFEGEIVGTREGTIIAAFGTGLCVKAFQKLLSLSDGRRKGKNTKSQEPHGEA